MNYEIILKEYIEKHNLYLKINKRKANFIQTELLSKLYFYLAFTVRWGRTCNKIKL